MVGLYLMGKREARWQNLILILSAKKMGGRKKICHCGHGSYMYSPRVPSQLG